jgi:hypothetical protein
VLATKKPFALAFTLALIILVVTCLQQAPFVSAQDELAYVAISMPVEYVNYTIVSVNGSLWAKIDGTYPLIMHGDLPQALPMVYPTPPGTTNISIKVNDTELGYSNYSDIDPSALHRTAIGDWEMVSTTITPVSRNFTLSIHYEHPLDVVNGSCLFLYDLNISPYLSPASTNSTAYFTVRMETNTSNLHVYTAETDSLPSEWKPFNYTVSKDGSIDVVSIVMFSEYAESLPGDLVVVFSSPEIGEYPYWVTVMVMVGFCSLALVYLKSKRYHAKN